MINVEVGLSEEEIFIANANERMLLADKDALGPLTSLVQPLLKHLN